MKVQKHSLVRSRCPGDSPTLKCGNAMLHQPHWLLHRAKCVLRQVGGVDVPVIHHFFLYMHHIPLWPVGIDGWPPPVSGSGLDFL